MINHSHYGSKSESTSDKPVLVSNSNLPARSKAMRKNRKRTESPQTESKSGFYRAFEERYRGPRDLIKRRLGVYLPFVEPLKQIYAECTAVDLGCGRGEWLELLQKNGFKAQGVDLDEGMLAACVELDLGVIRQDAIEHLKSLEDNSRCIVSGFHFAEHISFADLQVLVAEALRVLKPGGLLILETPNPENVVVGTTNFYLDPTHQRPIPPLLLSFLPEYQGFERVKILRLQESSDLADREGIALKDIFFGVSPDYAVVAQKEAAPEVLLRFNSAFDRHHGIELGDLTDRYDARIEYRITALDRRVGNVEGSTGGMVEALSRISALQDRLVDATVQVERSQSRVQEQEQRAVAAEGRAAEQEQRAVAAEGRAAEQEQRAVAAEGRAREQALSLEAKLAEANANAHHGWLQATAAQQRVAALERSLSWRITAPLRGTLDILKSSVRFFATAVRYPLVTAMRAVLARPMLAYRINQRILRYPSLHQRLLAIAGRAGLVPGFSQPPPVPTLSSVGPAHSIQGLEPDLSHLTVHARQIYRELKAAIERQQNQRDR